MRTPTPSSVARNVDLRRPAGLRTRSTCAAAGRRDWFSRAAQVLNHGIARLRTGDPEAGPFSTLRVPRRRAASTSPASRSHSSAPGSRRSTWRDCDRDYAETLRHWAAQRRRQPRPGDPPGGDPSASASGGSTCARRGAASRAASPRSTRCAAQDLAAERRHQQGPTRPSSRPGWDAPGRRRSSARGPTQRIPGGWHASWPMLGVYQSTTPAPCAAAWAATIAFSSFSFSPARRRRRRRRASPASSPALVGQDRRVVHDEHACRGRPLRDALQVGRDLRRGLRDARADLVHAVHHVLVLARRAGGIGRRSSPRRGRRSRCRCRRCRASRAACRRRSSRTAAGSAQA